MHRERMGFSIENIQMHATDGGDYSRAASSHWTTGWNGNPTDQLVPSP